MRRFYCEVVGWQSALRSTGDCDDFNMSTTATGETGAGIGHARGPNANLPSQWLSYLNVVSADKSPARCRELGGRVLDEPRPTGEYRSCVIEHSAGAVADLTSAA